MRRTEEEAKKVAEHKAAEQEYKLKMTALRKEIQQEVCKRERCIPGCSCSVLDVERAGDVA